MSGINPISGNSWPAAGLSPSAAAGKDKAAEKSAFGEALRGYLGQVDEDQQAASQAVRDLLGGKTQDVLSVVTTMAKADLSFKLLMGVRNKVIDAYRQTINMPI
jgi:flagellar hook-basal body complex protein FliE